jgi:hypothetical protein
MKELSSKIIPNFFTNEELAEIESIFKDPDVDLQPERVGVYMSKNIGDINSNYDLRSNYYYPGVSGKKQLYEKVQTKIQKEFGAHIDCTNWHILNAFIPYGIHSDSYDDRDVAATILPDHLDYAWTFLVPLDDYNSHTIVFEEESTYTKDPGRWIRENNIQPNYSISEETYQKYLTQEARNTLNYLTIDTIFSWKKGDLLAMSRHSFHASDNFPANGVKEKRALVGWSHRPKGT